MKPREIIILFVMLIVTAFLGSSTYAWHDNIHALQGQYTNRGIKVPDASKFCSTCSATFFNSNEINSNDGNPDFYYDATFWSDMDYARVLNGQVDLNSAYRTPDHDIDEGGVLNSLHQYGNGADVGAVNGKAWSAMSGDERDDFKNSFDSTYEFTEYENNSHLHVERGGYCDY